MPRPSSAALPGHGTCPPRRWLASAAAARRRCLPPLPTAVGRRQACGQVRRAARPPADPLEVAACHRATRCQERPKFHQACNAGGVASGRPGAACPLRARRPPAAKLLPSPAARGAPAPPPAPPAPRAVAAAGGRCLVRGCARCAVTWREPRAPRPLGAAPPPRAPEPAIAPAPRRRPAPVPTCTYAVGACPFVPLTPSHVLATPPACPAPPPSHSVHPAPTLGAPQRCASASRAPARTRLPPSRWRTSRTPGSGATCPAATS